MALPPLVSLGEFEAWEQRPVSNVSRAEAIIAAASTLVRSHTGRSWVDADGTEDGVTEVQLDSVRGVVLTVASRVYGNPAGIVQQGTGPFSRTVAAWSSYGLALTDDEKAQLAGTPAGGVPGLFSVRVEAPRGATGTRRYSVEYWELYDLDDDGS